MLNKIIAIVGPTASGKSALAVRLGRKFNGEIISVDSRQVYKGLDVGSGKLEVGKRGGIKHHLLDIANPKRAFTVVQYKKLAEKAMSEILARGRLPIFCGGTGFYLDTVLGAVTVPPVPPNKILRAKLERLSAAELLVKLKIFDPTRAEKIDVHNRRRLIRAIEIAIAQPDKGYPLRGPKGSPLIKDPKDCPCHSYDCLKIGILVEPDKLRQKINRRSALEFKSGLLKEVRTLRRRGPATAGRGLSWQRLDDLGLEYRFASRYLRGLITKEEMIKQLQIEIWHYAKRQMTWFKRDKNIVWIKTAREAEQSVRDFLKKSDKVE